MGERAGKVIGACTPDPHAMEDLMENVDFVEFSWDVPYRVRALAHSLLRRIAHEHNVYFQVRTVAEDPDPVQTDPSEAPQDPVRFADRVTLPPQPVDLLRDAAIQGEVHIYVHPPLHETS